MPATITISLKAAGLTHARGRSDKCEGEHDVSMDAVLAYGDSGLVPPDDIGPVLQALHEQAHHGPGDSLSWEYCRERGCLEAGEYL